MSLDVRDDGHAANPLAALRRFVRPRPARERCELCGTELADEHTHLVEVANRRLCCACDPCALLFSGQTAGKFRRVPRGVHWLGGLRMTDALWEELRLPINLAFFLHSTAAGRVVAVYPSPAGATEALPSPEAWQALVDDNPELCDLEPDVEALLVNRLGAAPEYYRVGIDRCYQLVGVIRTHWRGLSGGTEVRDEIGRFFAALKDQTSASGGDDHA
jgi:hypothetical protein